MTTVLAESLKRLLKKGNSSVTVEKIELMHSEGKLTEEEYSYILDITSVPSV